MSEPGLPVDSFKDAAPFLRRPFTPAAVKWKVQDYLGGKKDNAGGYTDPPKGALIVAYIDARLVIERLNLVIPHLWSHQFTLQSQGQMWCHLTVDGITRSDVGEGQGKGLVSDALKRAGVHFGIGVSLYAIPTIKLWCGEKDNELRRDFKERPTIDERTDAKLRAGYAKWLEEHGVENFGEPLNHGDSVRSQGDAETDETPAPAAEAPVSDVPSDLPWEAPPAPSEPEADPEPAQAAHPVVSSFNPVTGRFDEARERIQAEVPEEVSGEVVAELVDERFASDIFEELKRRQVTVGQFRALLAGVGFELDPELNLRMAEHRAAVLRALSVQQAVDLSKLVGSLPEAAAA